MGAPKVELQQDRKWVVEHHSGNREIVIDKTDPRHAVYIFNCHNCVVQIKGKVNAVSIDGCKKTGVVFEHVIAACELVNCNGVQVQCLGTVPTMSIDKSDGCQLFINADVAAGDFQLVTAKSSEINLTVVPADPNSGADAVELPVPEQFISSFKGGKLVTVAASHSGG
ncbi:MAG: adenylate cyclase-associated CAP [Monoraphidium minutum]|nr:MAG: adenylate cyclase-associated CAP [Monoraphidium minutum]